MQKCYVDKKTGKFLGTYDNTNDEEDLNNPYKDQRELSTFPTSASQVWDNLTKTWSTYVEEKKELTAKQLALQLKAQFPLVATLDINAALEK